MALGKERTGGVFGICIEKGKGWGCMNKTEVFLGQRFGHKASYYRFNACG